MRKLASLQVISDLRPIEGADQIEVARILGWNVVVKKGEFSVGDMVVYCEVDSILPDRPEFEFLKPRGFRIKTIKLRGQVSQGIAFPLSILPDYVMRINTPIFDYSGFDEDEDVTDILDIKKYELYVPAELMGVIRGTFPSFLPKTDETRVQSLYKVVEKYAGQLFWATEKVDGSSTTVFIDDEDVLHVCSRNMDILESETNSFWIAVRKHNIEEILRGMGPGIALQGELVGPGVQGNKLGLPALTIMWFNVYDFKNDRYWSNAELSKFELETWKNAGQEDQGSFEMVPSIPELVGFELPDNIDDIVKLSIRRSVINPKVWAEGIVMRPYDTDIIDQDARGCHCNRVSFKAINPEFLLKFD